MKFRFLPVALLLLLGTEAASAQTTPTQRRPQPVPDAEPAVKMPIETHSVTRHIKKKEATLERGARTERREQTHKENRIAGQNANRKKAARKEVKAEGQGR